MITQEFRSNRAAFPETELLKYRGSWVAFSPDGTRIVAAAEDIDQLFETTRASGNDPNQVLLEWVPGPDQEISLGGGEFC